MRIVLKEAGAALKDRADKLQYVGFMKTPKEWLPFCFASEPEGKPHLDSLFLADSYQVMEQALKSYAERIPEVRETLIQCLFAEEIGNLVERYRLENLALLINDEEGATGCECGCGCGG